MSMNRLQAFDTYLKANNIPIFGVSGTQPYGPNNVSIDFKPEATAEQIAWAEQAKLTFDWRPRRFLSDASIASAYNGLTNQQKQAILNRFIGLLVRQNETAVVAMFSDLGVSLPYDEVVP